VRRFGLNDQGAGSLSQLQLPPGQAVFIRGQKIGAVRLSQRHRRIIGIHGEQHPIDLQRSGVPAYQQNMCAAAERIKAFDVGQSDPLPLPARGRRYGHRLGDSAVHFHRQRDRRRFRIFQPQPEIIIRRLTDLKAQRVETGAPAQRRTHDQSASAALIIVTPAHGAGQPAQFRLHPEGAGRRGRLDQLTVAGKHGEIHPHVRHRTMVCVHQFDGERIVQRAAHHRRLIPARLGQQLDGRAAGNRTRFRFDGDGLVCAEIAQGAQSAVGKEGQQIDAGFTAQTKVLGGRRLREMARGRDDLAIAQQGCGIAEFTAAIAPEFGAESSGKAGAAFGRHFKKVVGVAKRILLQHAERVGAVKERIHIAVAIRIPGRGGAHVAGEHFGAGAGDPGEAQAAVVAIQGARFRLSAGENVLPAVVVKIGEEY